MHIDESLIDRPALAARRRRLAEGVDRPVLLPAEAPVPRNYPANPYPYRASSHFLYLVGAPLPGAWLLLEDGRATVFVEPPAADDALWHGPTPSLDALREVLGVDEVTPLNTLGERVDELEVATLPALHERTRRRQAALIDHDFAADPQLVEALVSLRLFHDAAAIGELRRAAEATVAAHRAGMRVTRAGEREWTVRAAMEAEFGRRGMGVAYGPIVTVHGEVLHARGSDGLMTEGDLLLCDVGAESRGGWAADVTRTWPVSDGFSTTQREIYEVVLRAQTAAIEAAGPGVRFRDLHVLAARSLTEGLVELGILRGDPDELVADDVHALFFPHGLGHLLGLDVHDMEDLGDSAGYAPGRARSERFGLCYLRLDRDLEPGMAVTIEPGFYQVPAILDDPERIASVGDRLDRARLSHFADVRGVRIEDDVLVTDTGVEVLTAGAPKSVEAVEALRRSDRSR